MERKNAKEGLLAWLGVTVIIHWLKSTIKLVLFNQ